MPRSRIGRTTRLENDRRQREASLAPGGAGSWPLRVAAHAIVAQPDLVLAIFFEEPSAAGTHDLPIHARGPHQFLVLRVTLGLLPVVVLPGQGADQPYGEGQ